MAKSVKPDNLFFVDIWELPKLVTHKLQTNFKQWRHNFDKDFYLFQYKVYVKIKTRIKSENFLNFLHSIVLKKVEIISLEFKKFDDDVIKKIRENKAG